jgi:outer membrane protein OmpA-like peptidoglycan-associated protein
MASRFVATADTIPLGLLGHTFALSLVYAKDPLIFKKAGLKTSDVVANQIATEAEAALGVLPFLDLGVAIPFVLETGRSADLSTSLPVANIADLRVTARARILDERGRRVGLSLSIETSVPTGSASGLVSSGFVSVAPMLAASFRAGAFAAAVNLGYRFRRKNVVANLTFDDELFYRLGAIVRLTQPRLDVIAEAFASTRAGSPWGKEVENPGEFVVAVRMPIRAGLSYTLGGGGTLLPGYGAPTARIFFGLTYASIREAPRAPEPRPLPPKEKPLPPEDPNGDADEDGVPNARDLCPYESDVVDGLAPPEPRDGCRALRSVAKSVDSDGDGLLDMDDDCPNAAGPKENRGCPIVDRDGDGVPDAQDKCPLDPDYRDDALARDGCAVVDSDGDGVPDLFDRCPGEPTSRDVPIDEYGCPMVGPHLVLLKADRLVIKQKVRFHPGTAHIRDESRPLLEQLVSVLKRHESIAKLRIDGHTDRVFPDEPKNIALSEEMAAAVMRYLVKRGIHAGRLAVFGYGPRRPIGSHATTAGKEENRRVEFVILERGSAKE